LIKVVSEHEKIVSYSDEPVSVDISFETGSLSTAATPVR